MGDVGYLAFFKAIAEAYRGPGGRKSLTDRISARDFENMLPKRKYRIAVSKLISFFEDNRVFGLDEYELRARCIERQIKERNYLVRVINYFKDVRLFSNNFS